MKYLSTYRNLNIENDSKQVFDNLLNSLTDSIFTWDYFVDFEKVKQNISLMEKELNLLNYLVGKSDLDKEFINLVVEYPKIRKILPILIAIRSSKLRDIKIIDDFESLVSESKIDLFNPSVQLDNELTADLLFFFKNSGLKNVFQNKDIKNVVDYIFGVEVGMDTNARKNRTGTSMEKIVEVLVKKFSYDHKLEYLSQATQKKIKLKWDIDINLDKANRIFDFVIFNHISKQIFVIETNYYGGNGSKLKSTAGEYQYLFDFLKKQKIDLIWVTDGLGWKTTEKALYETFLHNDYVLNIDLLKKGILGDIILK